MFAVVFGKEAACGEELTRVPRSWSNKNLRASLVSPFTKAELKLLKDMSSKISSKIVELDLNTTTLGPRLASLLVPISDNVKELADLKFVRYPSLRVVFDFFNLLEQRSEKFPKKYLMHYSANANMTECMLESRTLP